TRLYDHEPLNVDALVEECRQWGDQLRGKIMDCTPLVLGAVHAGKSIILEGQLGVQRDLDWGIYPYVTSSSAIAGGAASGAGIPPAAITNVVGVLKGYT